VGDFIVHNVEWLRYSSRTDDFGREAELFAAYHGFVQIIDQPTRISDVFGPRNNLLDLLLTNEPSKVRVQVLPPLGTSDHLLISTLIELETP
jgi:hypothetical protein